MLFYQLQNLCKEFRAIVLVISYFSCLAMRIWITPMQTLLVSCGLLLGILLCFQENLPSTEVSAE